MFEDSPIKKILFDKLVELGRLSPNPDISTIQTIKDISDSDATKLYNSITGGPSIQKNMGGMMNINRMTAPLGYKEAGEVGIRERIYNMLGPKDKISEALTPASLYICISKSFAKMSTLFLADLTAASNLLNSFLA